MTSQDRQKIKKAIDLLMDADGEGFADALILLGGLVGIRFPVFEAFTNKGNKGRNVIDVLKEMRKL